MTPIGPLRPGVFATSDDPWDHPRNPGSIALLCRFGARAGVEADVLLAGSGVSAHALGNPQLYVDARQEAAVMRNLIDLYDARAALGIDVGRDYHLTAYGYFGYLLINCATMLEVVTVALRFAPLTFAFTTWSARLSESGDYVLTFHADHLPSEIRRFAVERDVAASIQLQRELFPNSQGLPLRSVHFDFPPHSSPTYSNYFQAPVLFDQPTTQLVFEQSYLDMPLPLANPYTKLTLTRHCEGIRDTVLSRTGVVASVRSHLLTEQDLSAGLESTARQLYFTPRTVRRRLRESGTSFREVVDEVRRTLARELMTQTTLTKHEIAERLGYCDLSAFLRALRRWHG